MRAQSRAAGGREQGTTCGILGSGLVENHRAPVATQMIWYRVGAADEPRGSSGIAHFLEHLMFKGTDLIPAAQFSKIIARTGGGKSKKRAK